MNYLAQRLWVRLTNCHPFSQLCMHSQYSSSMYSMIHAQYWKPGLWGMSSYSHMITDNKLSDCHRLANKEALVKARVHPLRILFAELTLLKKWKKATIPPTLLSSLDLAFQLSFATAKPTGKKFMLALDVSGSMECDCMGSNVLNCRQATAAIAYILRRIEPRVKVNS